MQTNPSEVQSVESSGSSCALLPDMKLVEVAKQGSVEAFEEMHRRYARRLLLTAVRINRNREDCEDAVQETFLKAFRHLDSFGGRSSFYTWLTSILINTCLMQHRRKRGYTFLSLEYNPELGLSWNDALSDPKANLECEYAVRQRAQLLSKAISKLRPTLRSVMETYQENDFSIAEIAQHNSISSAAVKSRMLRAKAALRSSYRLGNLRQ